MKKIPFLVFVFTVITTQFYYAQSKTINTENDSINSEISITKLQKKPSVLNEIIVNANHLPTQLRNSTSSTSLISTRDIERANTININEALNRVPGVFMQTGALNTNRITIRGVGSRNLFGTSKIRAYFKDIPLTNGSGETSLEDFELGSISRIEITKGATSSTYGAGLGGVIQLLPKASNFNTASIVNETTIGTFGLFKNLSQFDYGNSTNNLKLVFSTTQSDGFRANNNYTRDALTLNSTHILSGKSELSILGVFSDLKAFIPSSLNETDFKNNPESAAFTWGASRGFEDTKGGLLGITLQHDFNKIISQNTSVFMSFRDSYEPRPFNILDESVFGYGLRHRVVGNFRINDKALHWTSGIEVFRDNYKHQTFENLYQDFPEENGSIQGNALSNFKERRQYYNLFFEGRYGISTKTDIVLGINYNKTSYDLEDRFPVSSSNSDESGNYKFSGIVSPKIGILHRLNSSSNLYANISHGFSPLSLEEALRPDGQINTNLNPETGWNFEVGIKGSAIKNRLQYNISMYHLAIKNLLVARRTSQDAFIGVNAGKTNHDGLEINWTYLFLNSEKTQISSFGSYSLNLYKFDEFIDEDTDFSGNDVTGVPSEVLNLGFDINSTTGFYGNFNFQYVGKMPITDSNSLYSENYNISNVKIGYQNTLAPQLRLNMFLGINNIFDAQYASQILINAASFGGNAPRYFYPGNPINYYSGLALNYSF